MNSSSYLLLPIFIIFTTIEMTRSYQYYASNYDNNRPYGYRFRRRLRYRRGPPPPPPPAQQRPNMGAWPDERTFDTMRTRIMEQNMNYFTEKFEKSLPVLVEQEMERRGIQTGGPPDAEAGMDSNVPLGMEGQEQMENESRGQYGGVSQELEEPNGFSNGNSLPEERPEVDYGAQQPEVVKEAPPQTNYDDTGQETGETGSVDNEGSQSSAYDYENQGREKEGFQAENILPPEELKSSAVCPGFLNLQLLVFVLPVFVNLVA